MLRQPLTAALCAMLLFAGPRSVQAARARIPERVDVTLVLLDTVVTDRKGESVRGLRAEDFELLVDNERVAISSVEERCGTAPAAEPGATGGRHLVILFDMSHMMPASRNDAIRATIKYVDEVMTADDRVMLLAFMRGLHVISGFSDNRPALMDKLRILLDDPKMVDAAPFEEANAIQQLGSDRARPLFGPTNRRVAVSSGANPARLQCLPDARQAEMQTGRALRAISSIMPALGGIPGRKALIFFTETLRSNPGLPFYTACAMPLIEQLTYGLFVLPELDELKARANSAGVSFYPVHAAGMSPFGSSTGEQSSRDFQVDVALATGGKNFVLVKRPLEPFQQAIRDLSCHYVLAFRPLEKLTTGAHAVRLLSRNKDLRFRHRKSFTIQTTEEASEDQFLSALSSPAVYRDLQVSTHVYSLGNAEARNRQVLLHASVPAAALGVVRSSEGVSSGSVLFRGGVVARGGLRCEFSETVPFQVTGGSGGPTRRVGVESLCALEPGPYEIVVVGRDELGGGLGTFWGKVEVKPAKDHIGSAALLWGELAADFWVRQEGASWLPTGTRPYFVQESFKSAAGDPSSLTVLVCNDSKVGAGVDLSAGPSSVRLEGPVTLELPAAEIAGSSRGACRMLKADIPPGSMPAGAYAVIPRPAPPWHAVGARTDILIH